MQKHYLSLFILTSCFTMISISSFSQSNIDQFNEYSLLWEISGNGLYKPSYLFGTMHVRDKRAFEFPDSVLIALDKCEAMATEIHFDSLYSELCADKIEEKILTKFYELDEDSQNL